jgi:TonB family protein
MIASWMSYAVLVGALVSIAAIVLERVAAARRVPARFVWFTALVLSIAWPVGSAVRSLAPRPMAAVTVLPFTITVQAARITGTQAPDRALLLDRALLVLWCSLSGLLVLRLARGIVVLARTRRAWTRRDVDGTPVQLSSNIGPAVVGLRSMDVVLPEWILSLDAPLRAIVLRHEEEHRLARDPYLLFTAAVGVALMPWNVALWLQARRLRLAIEMDCDARVLRAHPSAERYGLLMLTIAQRRSVVPSHFAPMLSEPTTQLERRIMAMRTTTNRLARLTAFGGTVIAMGVLAFACSLQSDTATGPKAKASPTRLPTPMNSNQTYFEFQVEKPVQPLPGNPAPRYPDALRQANIEGNVIAQFIMDTLGHPNMETFKVLKSTDPLFTETVRSSLPNMRFSPALVGGRPVKQLVQMPFMFSLTGQSSANGLNARDTLRADPTGVNVLRAIHITGAAKAGAPVSPVAGRQGVYLEGEVAKSVSPRPNNPGARYPDSLRTANVEGEVLAQFVVDENGHPDLASFRVLKTTHDMFSNAVRNALPNMSFFPAELPSGQRVKQLVQMPFQFSLTKH